ncbi:MAG: hypothetical protein V7L23_07540 [Nostoc sp.]|uniref:hypothetical protein n=1 Tax=Nostoc sp. TaxID=1180 RepID=UPI002FF39BE9
MTFSSNINYLDKCHITTMLQLCAFPKSTLQMQQKHLEMQHQIYFGLQIPKKHTQKWRLTDIFMSTVITHPEQMKQ